MASSDPEVEVRGSTFEQACPRVASQARPHNTCHAPQVALRERALTFTAVRDPLTRLVSGWSPHGELGLPLCGDGEPCEGELEYTYAPGLASDRFDAHPVRMCAR